MLKLTQYLDRKVDGFYCEFLHYHRNSTTYSTLNTKIVVTSFITDTITFELPIRMNLRVGYNMIAQY